MSLYGDLDISVIDELPPGRKPIATKVVKAARRDEVIGGLHDWLAKGLQAYWVCPLIEESDALQLQTAVESYAQLEERLPQFKIGLVHGRLKAEEKAAAMGVGKSDEDEGTAGGEKDGAAKKTAHKEPFQKIEFLVRDWQNFDTEDESDIASIDSALLLDELPPDAYTDPGFVQFLKLQLTQRPANE